MNTVQQRMGTAALLTLQWNTYYITRPAGTETGLGTLCSGRLASTWMLPSLWLLVYCYSIWWEGSFSLLQVSVVYSALQWNPLHSPHECWQCQHVLLDSPTNNDISDFRASFLKWVLVHNLSHGNKFYLHIHWKSNLFSHEEKMAYCGQQFSQLTWPHGQMLLHFVQDCLRD